MRFDIPENCHIRWQAALAVLEDLQEDTRVPFDMRAWADPDTQWEGECGTAACFGGYLGIAPYCVALGFPIHDISKWIGRLASNWLLDVSTQVYNLPNQMNVCGLDEELFDAEINKGSRAKTLAFLKKNLKSIFKESTGKTLTAPLTFYVD